MAKTKGEGPAARSVKPDAFPKPINRTMAKARIAGQESVMKSQRSPVGKGPSKKMDNPKTTKSQRQATAETIYSEKRGHTMVSKRGPQKY